jgi:MoxR-like ATPase
MSQEGRVVLLLDEIDKTMERTEALLLDWLQSGRVPIQPGVHLQTNLENVLVIATSNEQRDLTDAGTRRFCRVVMNPLDVKTQVALIHQRSGVDLGICKVLWKAARFVAAHEGNNALSIQEGIRLISAAFFLAESEKDVRIFLSQWAARTQKGRDMVANNQGDEFSKQSSAAWSEICRARGGA